MPPCRSEFISVHSRLKRSAGTRTPPCIICSSSLMPLCWISGSSSSSPPPPSDGTENSSATDAAAAFTIHANVSLPSSYAAKATAPPGGIVLRLRTPVAHAGRLAAVSVGGKAWMKMDATAETIRFEVDDLAQPGMLRRLQEIVATYDC